MIYKNVWPERYCTSYCYTKSTISIKLLSPVDWKNGTLKKNLLKILK